MALVVKYMHHLQYSEDPNYFLGKLYVLSPLYFSLIEREREDLKKSDNATSLDSTFLKEESCQNLVHPLNVREECFGDLFCGFTTGKKKFSIGFGRGFQC